MARLFLPVGGLGHVRHFAPTAPAHDALRVDDVIVRDGVDAVEARGRAAPAASVVLPGLPANLEASLQAAQKQGVAGLKNWLNLYRPYVSDPRLAAIELDYVVLISSTNPQEARRLFAGVKQRTPANSPVYPRVKQLEKTYQ